MNDQIQNVRKIKKVSEWAEYHLEALDVNNFNKISFLSLPIISGYTGVELSVSSVTITNVIRTLKTDDYITINNVKYNINDERSSLTPELWIDILDHAIGTSGVTPHLNNCKLIFFSAVTPFTINDMSYNVSLLLGIKQNSLPRESVLDLMLHKLAMDSYGDYNSTPIFFLMSNFGTSMFIQTEDGIDSYSIFMKINNSFSPHFPITYTGGDYKRSFPVISLHVKGEFQLLDSNMHDVDLQYPMRLSLMATYYKFVEE